MESSANHNIDGNLATFRLLYTVVQLIGLTLIVMMAVWVFVFLGGLGWTDPGIQFNWHPLMMTIGMIFLYGNCKINFGILYIWSIRHKSSHFLYNNNCSDFHSNLGIPRISICAQAKSKTNTCNALRYNIFVGFHWRMGRI